MNVDDVVRFTIHSIGGRSEDVTGTVIEIKRGQLIVQTETGHGKVCVDVDKATLVPVDWAGRNYGQLTDDEKKRVGREVAAKLQAELSAKLSVPQRTVLMTTMDLVNVLEGRELQVGCDDGTKIQIRMYTADELIAATAQARIDGGLEPSPMSRAMAENLTRRLPS